MMLLRGQVSLFVRTGFKQEARNVLLQKLREHSKVEEELFVASLAVGTVTVTPAQALQAVNHPEQRTTVGRRRHCYGARGRAQTLARARGGGKWGVLAWSSNPGPVASGRTYESSNNLGSIFASRGMT